MFSMDVFRILAGLVVLLFGRKLFWLFVGFAGFIVGFDYVRQIFATQPDTTVFLIALGIGILGAVLAILLQRVAIIVSGFAVGWYLTLNLLHGLEVDSGQLLWLIAIGGGIIGAILLWALFDYALIVLSSFAGASTIFTANFFRQQINIILFLVLFLVGVIVQISHLQKE